MKSRFLLSVVAAMVSFALVAGVTIADNCTHMSGGSCPGWGAENPPVQGKCCVEKFKTPVACGTGVKAVTQSESTYCGLLVVIVGGECTGAQSDGCGALCGLTGCTTANCSQ
jgi:hypothetical protein